MSELNFEDAATPTTLKIDKQFTFDLSERNKHVCKMYDISDTTVKDSFECDFNLDFDWNVGLIVGQSGTGKTTIAKEKLKDYQLFQKHEWDGTKSVIDNFNSNIDVDDVITSLTKVGFSSPLNWLKPYHLLSNGQQMRVDLARLLLETDEPVIFDEFTSVVDRDVAKVTSLAVSGFIKKNNYKFVAVSCHHDIVEWLQPDWVYDTDEKRFYRRSLWQRPAMEFKIREATSDSWDTFKNYHYLTHAINKSCKAYVVEYKDKPIAFGSVIHFPHPKCANFKRIHRMVVLPDYQGIGIGKMFLNYIAELYHEEEYRVLLTTGALAFINSLDRPDSDWRLTRKVSTFGKQKTGEFYADSNRATASFEFKNMRTKTMDEIRREREEQLELVL